MKCPACDSPNADGEKHCVTCGRPLPAARSLGDTLGGPLPSPPSVGVVEVVVTDVQMPFWSMVVFMVKWAIAAIPALIILLLIGAFVFGIIAGFARH